MNTHSDKVKLTVECTYDERAYIKMLAIRSHMTISDFILAHLRKDFPHIPNEETELAIEELEKGKGKKAESIQEFWKQMGVGPFGD
ncbi:MAG: hypothetical protein KDK62_06340 [Chlamydiia bacterium]|nr:hypothetical protein [Chlamydiia bacterium]